MKDHEAYKALPAKVAQWVLRLLDQNWQSYFAACAAWQKDPSKFLGHPKLPGYKDKQQGRNLLVYTTQALSVPALRQGMICSLYAGHHRSRHGRATFNRCASFPASASTSWKSSTSKNLLRRRSDPALHAGVDIGLNNLATLTSDKPGFVPRVVNGRPVKSINQFYNKRRAELQGQLGEAQHESASGAHHDQAHAAH